MAKNGGMSTARHLRIVQRQPDRIRKYFQHEPVSIGFMLTQYIQMRARKRTCRVTIQRLL